MNDLEELFFIYDLDAMQSEYDTLEGSLLYHHPKSLINDEEFMLMVGQLVGIVAFSEDLAGSVPSILRLEKFKFTIKKCQSYLLFLGTTKKNEPDSFFKAQLNCFVSLFVFFHGSFQRLKKGFENELLKLELSKICQCYLPYVKRYNFCLDSVFRPIQGIKFNKASYVILMKVNEMLESCQRRQNVLCGALISEERLISSQIPNDVFDNLTLLKPNQKNLPAESFNPGFECPYGIKIFKIYVTKQQYVKIMEVANCSPYKMNTLDTKQSSSKSNSSRKRIAKLQVTYNNKGSSSFHLGSRESLLSDNSFDNNSSFSRSLSDSLETVSSSSDNTSTANLLSQTEDSTEDLNSKLFSPISTTTTKTTTENIQDREEHVLANDNEDGMTELHLYVQGHSGTMLLLVMEQRVKYNQKRLKSLWEMVLPQLGDIEAHVKSLISNENEKNGKPSSDQINYLQYNKIHRTIKSNISNPINGREYATLDSVNRIHSQFQASSSLRDVTLRTSLTSVYGHQSNLQEVYYQQRGQLSHQAIPPSPSDVLWIYDQQLRSSKTKALLDGEIIL